MKGVLFRYSADPLDPLMRDKDSSCYEEGCALQDPDFWINQVPVWGICGPYIRTALDKGDIVFFVPKKISWKKAGLHDYVCTGILVVDRSLSDKVAVITEPLLTDTYKRSWEKDLDVHLVRDRREAPRTATIRGKNFIIGDVVKSHWFGRNEYYLKESLTGLGLSSRVKFTSRRIKNIEGNEALLLYEALCNKLVLAHAT